MFGRRRFFFEWGTEPRGPFQRGDLKYVILEMIRDKPRHGYEVIRALEERSHGFYAPSPGAVYPTLQMLEEMGYVTASQQDGKKVYTITDEGRRFLDARKETAGDIADQIRSHWGPESAEQLGEMAREFARFGRAFGLRLHEVGPDKLRRIRDVLARALKEIEAIIEEREPPTTTRV